jgi:hypothetical protein
MNVKPLAEVSMFKTIDSTWSFKYFGVRSLGLPEVLLCSSVLFSYPALNPSTNLSNVSRRLLLVWRPV